jgi:GGDEF domain-containing protein
VKFPDIFEARRLANRDDILQRLQQQASSHTLQSHLLGRRPDSPVGLLVFRQDTDYGELRQMVIRLLDTATSSDLEKSETRRTSDPFHPPKSGSLSRNIVELLEVEQARVAKTRLPCALLLVELDDFASFEESDAAMEHLITVCLDHLEAIDLLSVYGRGKIVIILPGISRHQAIKQAKIIKDTIGESTFDSSGKERISVSIALSLYQASNKLSAAALLEKTAEELEARGCRKNCLLFSEKELQEDASQVTVEERAELFSIVDRD